MSSGIKPKQPSENRETTPEQEAAIKAATTWVGQFARTLKTCRLYDAANPTVSKFRFELATSLTKLIEDHGALALRFSADDVLLDDVSLYPAKSRDDNLALPFFRDGIRSLTFSPGVAPHEVGILLNAVLQVTGQTASDDDLVTLLWQAHLEHIEVDYVPAAGDGGGGADGPTPERGEGSAVPWPSGGIDETAAPSTTTPESESTAEAISPSEESSGRSDDWHVGEMTTEIEAGFEELASLAASEMKRFQEEYEIEHQRSTVATALMVSNAFLTAGLTEDDRAELSLFVPRVLRMAFLQGNWKEACDALDLLDRCKSEEWSLESFSQELLQPISVSSIREHLDHQEPNVVSEFVSFATRLGEPSVELLNLVLAETQNPRHQKVLTEAITELCRENPEQLAPWLNDRRAFVVRNTVQILGAIGGNAIVGMLQAVAKHPEARIRQEVVAALKQVEPRLARPLLLGMLEGSDARMFCTVVHQLSQVRDPGIARKLLEYLKDPDFDGRVADEKRAIYSAISNAGGDDVITELEGELHKGSWFSRAHDAHRQAVARCIARIGSPLAKETLERGAQSRRASVRKACEDALARFDHHD